MVLSTEQALKKTEALYARLNRRRPEIASLEKYFRGDQPLSYASDEWRKVHRDRYKNFADNWCGVVGSAPGERTELYGFRLGEDGDPVSADEKALWRDWEVNDGPAQASQGFLMSTIAKRSAAIVWGTKDDEPTLTWEHPAQVIVDYDPESPRRRKFGLKSWREDDLEFATLYEADAVWKWQRPVTAGAIEKGRTESGLLIASTADLSGGGWVPRQGDDNTWPISNPLGKVPVVEFQNRPMLAGEPISDIDGTRSMQDAVNMLWAYLFVAADYASMPARVVTGQEPPKLPILDENGQKIGEKPVDIEALTKGRMLWLTGQNAKVAQWDAAKLDVFTDVINVAVRHVAAQTRTPIYLVHGELGNVNGETLTGLDAPLVSKVREAHKFYRTPMREVFSLMAAVRGNESVADAALTGDAQWKNPEVRSDAQISDAALKDRNIGWSFAGVLEKRYGLSQPEIERQLALIKSEQETDPYLAGQGAKEAAADGVAAEPSGGGDGVQPGATV
ncbi:MAG: hypothetical protein K0S70_200 [Microbacterium sp.]|nr:hypothetical protein [Microbacterium sp.]